MDVYLDDSYPADAAYGSDFLTRNAQGDVQVSTPNGIVLRRERIIISSAEVDYEGRICIGERTIRHLAHQFDLVDRWRVDEVHNENVALKVENRTLSHELAEAREQNRLLRELEARPPERIYLSLNGTEYATARAAVEAVAEEVGHEHGAIPATLDQPQEVTTP